MKKAKADDAGSKSMDILSELPKEILQRILYFLSQEDAVRTSVLSKSWRYIWCTRPNLDFSKTSLIGKKEFLSIVDKTLHRYCDQRLCLEKFRLRILLTGPCNESVSFLNKWIPLLTNMGVKKFRLSIVSNQYVYMPQVVFKAESLKLLYLNKCNLGQNTPENIPFVRLRILRLLNVNFIKKEISDTIISSCPLLTTMWFEECEGLKTIKLEKKIHKYLKHFTFINLVTHKSHKCSIDIDDIPTLETIKIFGSKIRFHGHKFSNLQSLSVKWVKSYSESIEQSQLICNIDAPNIEYFKYDGKSIPSISFTPTSRKRRRSVIQLNIHGVELGMSWFLKLSRLVQALSEFEISLDISQYPFHDNIVQIREDILVQGIINGGNKPVVVEHFRLNFIRFSSLPSFLKGLFCICRPKKINQKWYKLGDLWKEREQRELVESVCILRERGNQEIRQDLEDISIRVEFFREGRRKWQPLRLHGTMLLKPTLPDISSISIRLKWSEACVSSRKLLES